MSKEMKELESQQSVCDIAWYLYKYTADESRHKREREAYPQSLNRASQQREKEKEKNHFTVSHLFLFFLHEREREKEARGGFFPSMSGIVNKERAAAAAHSSSFSPFPFFFNIEKYRKNCVCTRFEKGREGGNFGRQLDFD